MDAAKFNAVDDYLTQVVLKPLPEHEAVLQGIVDAEMPQISVSAPLGGLLKVLARSTGAKRILEIGTLGGYSTVWLAQSLAPGGKVVSLEFSPKHAEVAARNLAQAGVSDLVEIKVGAALDTLPSLEGPFDFIFVDADKRNNPRYLEWGLKLARPGALILIDNVVRGGAVLDEASSDPDTLGTRELHQLLGTLPGITSTVIQMVGHKGWDGFALVTVH